MVHVQTDHVAQLEGLLVVVGAGVGVFVLHAFQELPGPDPGVFVGDLSDLN